MTIQTLIKQAQKSGLVILPRKEYEELLDLKKAMPTFKPTKAELKAIARGEIEIALGKFKSWSQVKNELAHIRNKHRGKTT